MSQASISTFLKLRPIKESVHIDDAIEKAKPSRLGPVVDRLEFQNVGRSIADEFNGNGNALLFRGKFQGHPVPALVNQHLLLDRVPYPVSAFRHRIALLFEKRKHLAVPVIMPFERLVVNYHHKRKSGLSVHVTLRFEEVESLGMSLDRGLDDQTDL